MMGLQDTADEARMAPERPLCHWGGERTLRSVLDRPATAGLPANEYH